MEQWLYKMIRDKWLCVAIGAAIAYSIAAIGVMDWNRSGLSAAFTGFVVSVCVGIAIETIRSLTVTHGRMSARGIAAYLCGAVIGLLLALISLMI